MCEQDDVRQYAREAVLSGMASIEDEFQALRATTPRLTELEKTRWSFIRAYEALTPEISGDACKRTEQVEAVLASYRRSSS